MTIRQTVSKLSTGSENFNNLMGGGFETGAITECFGEFGSGKTQIGHLLAVNTLKAYPDASVVYIDTENTFRPERIKQLAAGINFDSDEIRIYFDEYIKLKNLKEQLIISPPLENEPVISPQGGASKFIQFDIEDTLKLNTIFFHSFRQFLNRPKCYKILEKFKNLLTMGSFHF